MSFLRLSKVNIGIAFGMIILLPVITYAFGFCNDTKCEKESYYIGVTVPYNAIGGDFDGETMLSAPGVVFLVPKVESSSNGWGVLIGWKCSKEKSAVEFSYLGSKHNVTWFGIKGDADYGMLSLDYKRYCSVDKPLQPYFLLGWVMRAWLNVKEASVTPTRVGDATFSVGATGVNLGGGLEYVINPNVSLNGGIIYRWMSFGYAKGVDGNDREIIDSLNGSGLNYIAGMTYAF